MKQVFHKLFSHTRRKRLTVQSRRLSHRFQSRFLSHTLHVEAGAQPVENQWRIRVERSYVVIAQNQHHPQIRVSLYGRIQLPKKRLPLLPSARMAGDDLLKLVEDQGVALSARRSGRRTGVVDPTLARLPFQAGHVLPGQTGQEVDQGDVGQPTGVVSFIHAEQQVANKDVLHLPHLCGQIAADTPYGQHNKILLLLQPGNEAGVQKRTFARTRLGVEKQQPFRQHPGQQIARLTFTAKEKSVLLVGKGAGPNVGIGRLEDWGIRKGGHGGYSSLVYSSRLPQ